MEQNSYNYVCVCAATTTITTTLPWQDQGHNIVVHKDDILWQDLVVNIVVHRKVTSPIDSL